MSGTEICADCGKPIKMGEPSYYSRKPEEDIGRCYHSRCGDPFGHAAKAAEITRLRAVLQRIADANHLRSDGKSSASVLSEIARNALEE